MIRGHKICIAIDDAIIAHKSLMLDVYIVGFSFDLNLYKEKS
jgi:hypothetical protein